MNPLLLALVVLDRAVNKLLGGSFYQTLSARAFITAESDQPYWSWTEKFINFLFFWEKDHCRSQWEREQINPLGPLTEPEIWSCLLVSLLIVVLLLM